MGKTQTRYNAEIVAGALIPNESRIIAQLILDGTTENKLKHLLTIDNILQKRSPATAVRAAELIKKRFALVNEDLLRIIVKGSRQALMQALFVAAIKHNKLIGDFLLRVVKEKWRLFERKLVPSDRENFLRDCRQMDETGSNVKPLPLVETASLLNGNQAGFLSGKLNFIISCRL